MVTWFQQNSMQANPTNFQGIVFNGDLHAMFLKIHNPFYTRDQNKLAQPKERTTTYGMKNISDTSSPDSEIGCLLK
jgi:hypothetical protein